MESVREQLRAYHAWLKDRSVLRQIGDWVEITTPYLDRHNDYLQIYTRPSNGGLLLTDDGETIRDLEQSGCSLKSARRQELLRTTVNGFGVRLEGRTLQVDASTDDFPLARTSHTPRYGAQKRREKAARGAPRRSGAPKRADRRP